MGGDSPTPDHSDRDSRPREREPWGSSQSLLNYGSGKIETTARFLAISLREKGIGRVGVCDWRTDDRTTTYQLEHLIRQVILGRRIGTTLRIMCHTAIKARQTRDGSAIGSDSRTWPLAQSISRVTPSGRESLSPNRKTRESGRARRDSFNLPRTQWSRGWLRLRRSWPDRPN